MRSFHLITYVLQPAVYPTHTSTSHLLRPSYSTDLSKVHPLYRSVLYKGTNPITSSHAHLSILKCCCGAYTCDRAFSTPSCCAYVNAPFYSIESTFSQKNSLTKYCSMIFFYYVYRTFSAWNSLDICSCYSINKI